MKNTLTPEQISQNWDDFLKYIDTYISSPRKDQLLDMYLDLEEEIVLAPAASSEQHHNAFPGGYIDHVNRVIKCSLEVLEVWEKMGMKCSVSKEELVFSAVNHDLGKIGFKGRPNLLVNDNQWEIEKLGKVYKINPVNNFFMVPDRSLFLLQKYGIEVTENEYIAIKIHDGLYDDSNKPYFISHSVESRLRSPLAIILHQADLMASRIEWETRWLDHVQNNTSVKSNTKAKPAPVVKNTKDKNFLKALNSI